ncbi:hypothetical protein H4582DRAFT_1941315 [Lactarius indigo]|nr:hypothetical protein H4582DRAFT_1941315 [Lactarius indigo]
MSGYDPYTQSWGNPPSNGAASFDHNVASSQFRSRQQNGAPVAAGPYYPELNQIAAASEAPQRHAAAYPAPVQAAARTTAVTAAGAPQFTGGGASGSTPRDTRRGHKLEQSGPQAAAASPQLNISGLPRDYHQHLSAAGWTPAPVVAGRRPSHADPHAGRRPGADYSLPSSTQPPIERQRRCAPVLLSVAVVYGDAHDAVSLIATLRSVLTTIDAGPGGEQPQRRDTAKMHHS